MARMCLLLVSLLVGWGQEAEGASLHRLITKAEVEEAVREFMLNQIPDSVKDIVVQVDHLPRELCVPKGEVKLVVRPGGRMDLKGKTLLTLEILVNGDTYKMLPLTANIRWFERVAVARNRIGRHQLIKPEDLKWERRETTQLSLQAITQMDQVVGRMSKVIINPGRIILTYMVDLPPVIKRGDLVTVLAVTENLTITTLGKAKQDGKVGDLISVINLDSGKEIVAQVKDSKTVVVILPGKS